MLSRKKLLIGLMSEYGRFGARHADRSGSPSLKHADSSIPRLSSLVLFASTNQKHLHDLKHLGDPVLTLLACSAESTKPRSGRLSNSKSATTVQVGDLKIASATFAP